VVLGLASAVAMSAGQPAIEPTSDKRPRASHENLDPGARIDELGIFVPLPVSDPGRRFPASDDFPTGPAVGERLPDFVLPDQHGELIDFHAHRNGRRAVVMFQRSVVW